MSSAAMPAGRASTREGRAFPTPRTREVWRELVEQEIVSLAPEARNTGCYRALVQRKYALKLEPGVYRLTLGGLAAWRALEGRDDAN